MNDEHKTKKQLVDELTKLRSQLAKASCHAADLEEALRASQEGERRFRILFEQVPIAYQSLDEDGRFIEVNQAWLDMLGYVKEQVIGKSFSEFLAPGLQDRFVQLFERFKVEGEAHDVEWEMVHKNSAHLIVSFEGVISCDPQGNFRQTHCTMRNITDRKLVEEALQESEERFRSVYSQSPIAIELYDFEGRLIDANAACLDMFGVADLEAVKGFNLFEDPNVPEDAKQRLLAGEAVKYESEFDFELVKELDLYETTRSGRCCIDCLITPWLSGAGTPVGFLVHVRDITARKQAEETLRRRNHELLLLNQTSQMFGMTLDLDRVLTLVLEEVRRLLDVTACSIWLLDPGTDELVCQQATGPSNETVRGWRLAPGEGIGGATVVSGQSQFVPDTHADERYFAGVDRETGLSLRSILSVPLQSKGNVIGVIQTVDTKAECFDAEDLTLLESLAASAGIAIENARLYQEAQRLWNFNENIVQNVGEGILLEDAAGFITFVNPKAVELLGHKSEELLGRHWTDFVAPESLARAKKKAARRSQGVASQYEGNVLAQGGRRIPVIVSARPLFEDERFSGVLTVFTDITKHKQAEEALESSRRELQITLDATTDGIWTWNFVTDELSFSPRYYTMLGYEPDEFPASFESWENLIHPDDLEDTLGVANQWLQAKSSRYENEFRLRTKSGEYRWVHASGVVVERDGNDQAIRMIGNHQDITERKRAEKALQNSEQKYRMLVENLNEGIWHIDKDAYTIFVNPRMAEMLGYTVEEMQGKHLFEFMDERGVEIAKYNLERRQQGITEQHDFEFLRKDGTRIYTSLETTPITDDDGNYIGALAGVTDITDRKRAEEALREAEMRYRTVADFTYDWEYWLTQDNALCYVSPSCERITGYRAEQFLDSSQLLDQIVLPQDRDSWNQHCECHLSASAPQVIRFGIRRQDGEIRWIEHACQPVVTEQGTFLGVRASNRDITKRKQVEKNLRESEERFRRLSEAAFEAIAIHEGGVILSANDQYFEMFGYEPDEILGKQVIPLTVAPEAREFLREQIVTDSLGPYESVGLRKNGTKFPMEIRVREMEYEGRKTRVGAIMDITDRKRAEETLMHRMEQLTALNQASQLVTASLDLGQVLTEVVSLAELVAASDHAGVVLVNGAGQPDQSAESTLNVPTLTYLVRDEGLTRWIIRSRQSIVGEIDQDGAITPPLDEGGPRFANPHVVELGARSFAGLPMIANDRLLGVLYLHSLQPGAFRDQLPVLTTFTNQAAIAIENARLYQQVQHYTQELERRVADRTRDLSILYEVTAIASEVLDLETALTRALEHILVVMQGIVGEIYILGGTSVQPDGEARHILVHHEIPDTLTTQIETVLPAHGLVSWVFEHDESLLVPDISDDPRASDILVPSPLAYVGVPIRVRGQTLGVLGIFKGEEQPPFNMDEITLLTSIADHMGIVVESARLRRRIEQAAVLEERERLARELHDSITQSLYGLTLFAKWARGLCDKGDLKGARQRVARIGETAQQALKEMRLLVYELRPELLEQDGLAGALQRRLDAVEKRAEVEASLQTELSAVLPAPVEEGLYRIAQEALNNALKHAGASQVAVRVAFDGKRATLEVEDNGSGFASDEADHAGGLGLTSMRERAEKLGGTLAVHSEPGEGTTVQVTVETSSQKREM